MNIKFYSQDNDSGCTALDVDTSLLAAFGSSLTDSSESLDTELTALNSKMATVTNSWKDANGVNFAAKFAAFITEAKKVKDDINSLGTFASSEASKYDNIVSNAKNIINGDTPDE